MPSRISTDFNMIYLLKERPEVRLCPKCGDYTHKYEDGFFASKKPKKDLSLSTEGIHMVSPALKTFFDENEIIGIEYWPLKSGFFVMRPCNEVYLDLSESNPRASDFCIMCGRFNGFHAMYKPSMILSTERKVGEVEIFRTTQNFADENQRFSQIVVGDVLAKRLLQCSFSGIFLSSIEYAQ